MAIDKAIDSTLLDASCTYEAGKIRAKLGSAAQIAYDLANGKGFGAAIEAIPTGGGVQSGSFTPSMEITSFSVEITAPVTNFVFYTSDYPQNGLSVGWWVIAGTWFNGEAKQFYVYNDGTSHYAAAGATVTISGNQLTLTTSANYKLRHEKTYLWEAW